MENITIDYQLGIRFYIINFAPFLLCYSIKCIKNQIFWK